MANKYYEQFECETTDILASRTIYGKDGCDINVLVSSEKRKDDDGEEKTYNTYKVKRFLNAIDYAMYTGLGLETAETIVELDQEVRRLKKELESK